MDLKIKSDNWINYIWYFKWKKVWFAKIHTDKELVRILLFATSNGKKPEILMKIKWESYYLYEKLKELDDFNMKWLWYNFLKNLILLIKRKKRKTNTLYFSPSRFALQINFYQKALEKIKEEWIIKNYKKKSWYFIVTL